MEGLRIVVEFFFMSKSQPHRCYLVSSVVLIIIILLLSFNTFTSNDGKVTTLSYRPEWSYWPYNSAFRKLSSIYVFSYFPFVFEGRIWDPIVSVPDHCLSFYFTHVVLVK